MNADLFTFLQVLPGGRQRRVVQHSLWLQFPLAVLDRVDGVVG
jgi:hypothetical protein